MRATPAVPPRTETETRTSTALDLASPSPYSEGGRGDGEGSGGESPLGTSTGTENDFRTFLNQCSLQSFMFLLKSTRDPHTIRWLDNFTQPSIDPADMWQSPVDEVLKVDHLGAGGPGGADAGTGIRRTDTAVVSELLRYHGLGAVNTTLFPSWETYFRGLLDQNGMTLVVETYDPRFPEFEVEINPTSLCSRILSVREQIAREFARDLKSIAGMGRNIFQSYWEEVERIRGEGFVEDDAGAGRGTPGAAPRRQGGFERQSLLFLDWDPNYDEDARPSPLRKGNFDLLALLCTQESVHRLIQSGASEDGDSEDQAREHTRFLRNFYAERLYTHFTGAQRYGRADDFVQELMMCSPLMVTGGQDGGDRGGAEPTLVDPLKVAKVLLNERERVALEWSQVATDIPKEHTEIQRMQLDKMMGL